MFIYLKGRTNDAAEDIYRKERLVRKVRTSSIGLNLVRY